MAVDIDATLIAVDAEIVTYYQDILDMQSSYYTTNSKYAQGLPTHAVLPEDGLEAAPTELAQSPTDQAESWNDLITLPSTLKAAIEIDIYQTPTGWGYIVTFRLLINGIEWVKSIDEGPTGRDRDWYPLSDDTWEEDVVSYWPFNETSGTRYDQADDNHFTTYNTPHYTANGMFDNALWCQCSSDEYIKTSMSDELANDSSWTFTGWVYIDDNGDGGQWFFRLLDSEGWNPGLLFYNSGGSFEGYWEWWLFGSGLGFDYVTDYGNKRWYFIEVFYDADTQKTGLAIDNSVPIEVSTTYTENELKSVYFGGTLSNGGDAQLDQWRFFNRRLTRAEALALFEEPQIEDDVAATVYNDLRAAWHMEEVSDTRYDSINDFDLTPAGSVDRIAGKLGYAANFDASNNEELVMSYDGPSSWWSTDWSMGMWLRINCNYGQKVWNLKNGLFYCGFLQYNSDINEICFEYGSAIQSGLYALTPSGFDDDEWHWVYWQYDATANSIGISVDNGPLQTRAQVGSLPTGTDLIKFGCRYSYGDDCDIDAAHWWGKLLTQAEREYMYYQGIGRGLE